MAAESDKPATPDPAPQNKGDAKPPAPAPAERGGKDKRKPPRDEKRRERPPMRRLDADFAYHQKNAPNVRDLDAEIAGELEAALAGMDEQSLLNADDSKRARAQAAAQTDHGKKIGTILSIHGPDIFVDIPGGRGQGVL